MMRRCLFIWSQVSPPYSGVTGKKFPLSQIKALAEATEARGFTSPYWVPQIVLKPDAGEGVTMQSTFNDPSGSRTVDVVFYNADQTTDPEAVKALSAFFVPRITVKPDAGDGETTDPEAVKVTATNALLHGPISKPSREKVYACSGVTGKKFSLEQIDVFSEVTEARGFTSSYWLTPNQIKAFVPQIVLKPDAGDGVTMQSTINDLGGNRTIDVVFYNADQTTDAEAVKVTATNALSALTPKQIRAFVPRITVKPDAGDGETTDPPTKERLSAEKIARIPHAKDVPAGAKDKGLCMNCGEDHFSSACPKECIRCEDNHTGAQCPKINRGGPEAVKVTATNALLHGPFSKPRKEKVCACSGVTGKKFPLEKIEVFSEVTEARGFTSSYWLTPNQIKAFVPQIALKPDAGDGVTMQSTINDLGGNRTIDVVFFNADQTTDPEAVAVAATKALSAGPISYPSKDTQHGSSSSVLNALTGKGFPDGVASLLTAAATAHGFTSPYWLTPSGIGKLSQIKTFKPRIALKLDAGKGVTGLGSRGTVVYYNADQTTNPEAVAVTATKALLHPVEQARSGVTGKKFPLEKIEVFSEVTEARGFTSSYWLTPNQIEAFVPQITLRSDAGEGVKMEWVGYQGGIPGGPQSDQVLYYNADQTTDPEAVSVTATKALGFNPFRPKAFSPSLSGGPISYPSKFNTVSPSQRSGGVTPPEDSGGVFGW